MLKLNTQCLRVMLKVEIKRSTIRSMLEFEIKRSMDQRAYMLKVKIKY